MNTPRLAVERDVVVEMVRRAALEVPGVIRVAHGGPVARRAVAGPAVRLTMVDGIVTVRVTIVARASEPLEPLTRAVRAAVAATLERLLDLKVGTIDVVVDGVDG